MRIRNRTRKRPRAEPDPLVLSALLVVARGGTVLGRVRPADAPPDLLALDGAGHPLLVAVVGPQATPGERLGVFVRLLGRDDLAAHVRRGCGLEVHVWSKRGGAWAVDMAAVTAEDFGPAEGSRNGP
jgi:hypothetical protein